jgi:hypothetical protein
MQQQMRGEGAAAAAELPCQAGMPLTQGLHHTLARQSWPERHSSCTIKERKGSGGGVSVLGNPSHSQQSAAVACLFRWRQLSPYLPRSLEGWTICIQSLSSKAFAQASSWGDAGCSVGPRNYHQLAPYLEASHLHLEGPLSSSYTYQDHQSWKEPHADACLYCFEGMGSLHWNQQSHKV